MSQTLDKHWTAVSPALNRRWNSAIARHINHWNPSGLPCERDTVHTSTSRSGIDTCVPPTVFVIIRGDLTQKDVHLFVVSLLNVTSICTILLEMSKLRSQQWTSVVQSSSMMKSLLWFYIWILYMMRFCLYTLNNIGSFKRTLQYDNSTEGFLLKNLYCSGCNRSNQTRRVGYDPFSPGGGGGGDLFIIL